MTKVRRYAEGTTVAVEKSRMQIEKLLSDHGADAVMVFSDAVRGSRARTCCRACWRQKTLPQP